MTGRGVLCLCLALTAPLAMARDFALRFSSPEHKVIVPACGALDIRNEITLEAWVFAEPAGRQRMVNYILSKNYAGSGYDLVTRGQAGNIVSSAEARSVESLTTGKWTHVALSRNLRAIRLNIDGKLVGLMPTGAPMSPNQLQLWIGASPFLSLPGSQPTNWMGRIQEVRIWAVARSEKQIRGAMFHRLTGKEPGLRAYFPLNEGHGQVVHDLSGHTPDGHLGDTSDVDAGDPQWADGLHLRPAGA